MKKKETLRGRGAYSSLYERGTRVDGQLLRCFFHMERGAGTPLRAGFSVSSRTYNAVKRNRIRRLMRAAFDAEGDALRERAREGRLSLLFVFKGRQGVLVERLALKAVRVDMAMLLRDCAGRITGRAG